MKRGGTIARRYARALFNLGEDGASASSLLAEVDEFTDLVLENEELRRVVFTPIHPRAERRAVVAELAERLELSREIHVFVTLLVDENRMVLLPQMRDALRELVERAAGRVDASVVSARPLEEAQAQRLREVLSRRVGADVTLHVRVDEDLLGGVVVRVGDLMLDGSVETQLETLARTLRRGSV